MNGDADWLRVVVGMTKQHGHHLHPGRGRLPRPLHHRPLQRPLTVYGILAHLRPGSNKGTLQSSLFLLFTCYYILLLLYIDNFPTEGGGCVYVLVFIYLRVFMFWFVRENAIPGNFGFASYWH